MSRELLKAWVHWALANPVDDHQLAHAKATKELLEENYDLRLGRDSWQKEAEANEEWAVELKAENARYREALEFIAEGRISATSIKHDYIDQAYQEIAREALKGSD